MKLIKYSGQGCEVGMKENVYDDVDAIYDN